MTTPLTYPAPSHAALALLSAKGAILIDGPCSLTGVGARGRRHFRPRWDSRGRLYIGSGATRRYVTSATRTDYGQGVAITVYSVKP